jgi:hypothetical protein
MADRSNTNALPIHNGESPYYREPVLDAKGNTLTNNRNGRHFVDSLDGRVFSQQNTPLGLAIPIYTATAIAGAMPIWNPPTSGVNVEILAVNVARASGTSDFGAIGVMLRKLNAIATGEICTAFAATTPDNAIAFGGRASKVSSSNAGTVTVSAGVAGDFKRTLFSMNLEADTGTAHALAPAEWDAKGTLIVPPGVLFYLAATKASVALISTSVTWKEVPIL